MSVTISRAAKARILGHAAESLHFEACGLLFGDEGTITRVQAAENVADAPEHRFEIDPEALFSAIRSERQGGERMIGHYHSHPRGPSEPSEHDAAMALDVGRLWLIVADGEMRLWRVVERHRFVAVELSLASDGLNRH
nr:M67 family metallopeptidase [Parasphingopyxis marina]